MQSRDFCFWLQGLMEVGRPQTLDAEQVESIKAHLALVFQHDAGIKKAEMAHPAAFPARAQELVGGPPATAIAYC